MPRISPSLARLAGLFLFLAMPLAGAPTAGALGDNGPSAVFGPEGFARSPGKPKTVTRGFAVGDPAVPHTLCVVNGGNDGQYVRVSSAIVAIGRQIVLGPADFNRQVEFIERPVSFDRAGTHILRVEIRSGPTSGFTLSIVSGNSCFAAPSNGPPAITSTPPAEATLYQPYLYPVVATDPDQDALTFSLVAAPPGMTIDPATGLVSWTPPGTGAFDVVVSVADPSGAAASQPYVLTVPVPPNAPPELSPIADRTIPLGTTLRIRLTADDPNPQDVLTYGAVTVPAGAAFNPVPVLEWTPTAAQLGVHGFQVDVRDPAGASDSQIFMVNVVDANLPPAFAPQPDVEIVAGSTFTRTLSAEDPNPGDPLTFSLDSGPAGLVLVNGNRLEWTPPVAALGTHPVSIRVTDAGGLSATASFNVTVTAPASSGNAPPVARNDEYVVRQDQTLNVPAPGVIGNDTDPDGDALTSALVQGPTSGGLTFNTDGSFTYTPAPQPPRDTTPALKYTYDPADGTNTMRGQPLVVDLDRDGLPEIVFVTTGAFQTRRLNARRGTDGSLAFAVDVYQPPPANPAIVLEPNATLAAGDIDGDGFPEIVAVDADSPRRRLIAFEHDGTYKWTSVDLLTHPLVDTTTGFDKPTIADINGDGTPEIVVGYAGNTPTATGVEFVTVYDNQGQIVWTAVGNAFSEGLNPATGITTVADIDLDGNVEILFGDDVFDHLGNVVWSGGLRVREAAVANMDDDAFAEVVYRDVNGRLSVREHDGTLKWSAASSLASVGSLVLGDANGDGEIDIVLADRDNVRAFSRAGTALWVTPLGGFEAQGGFPTIFDLDADGTPEIVYQAAGGTFTQGTVYIMDGATGAILHALDVPTGNAENFGPVVADVDGDGAAEIVTGNRHTLSQPALFVFEAANGHWAPTRPVWNQQGYHVTNVNRDGTIPSPEQPNWLVPGLNNLRVNVPLPEERPGGSDQFTYRDSDGQAVSNEAAVSLVILPANGAPTFLGTPPLFAAPGVVYQAAARAVDPDPGDVLAFSLEQGPPGMTINAATGLLTWTPAAGDLGGHPVTVKVEDLLGQTAFQHYLLTVAPAVVVPSMVGLTETDAGTALAGAGLAVGTVTTFNSPVVPVGEVISHEPAAGAVVATGSGVNLVVSAGPAPVFMPNVVGLTEGTAQAQLSGLGFAVTSSRVFSDAEPAGRVIAQDPAPGTQLVPGAAALTISAGNGLLLRLDRTFTTADVPIGFSVEAFDVNGAPVPLPPLTFSIAASATPFAGTLPAASSDTITPALSTRGAFRLTVTDPATSRSVSADFAVTYPRTPGQPSMMDAYAEVTEAMADIDALIRQGPAALAAGDEAQVNALLNQMVTRWRAVDRDALTMAVPFAFEAGFPPTLADLSLFGVTPAADDLLVDQILEDAVEDLDDWIAGLRAPNTPITQLTALADRFGSRAARLDGLTVTEWGAVNARGEYAVLASHRLPALYDALIDEIADLLGLPAEPDPFPGLQLTRTSSLAEQVATVAMQYLVDTMIDNIDQRYKNAKQFTTDILKQAAYGAAVVALAQHIRTFVPGQDLTAVVSGASLSFRVFGAPYAMIEGTVEAEYPDLNTVVLIGPQVLEPIAPLVESLQAAVASGGGNQDSIWQRFTAIRDALADVAEQTQGLATEVGNAFQTAPDSARGCLFSSAASCNALLYPSGFQTVYEYTPPQGFGNFTGLPLPIVFIVYNHTTGVVSFGTPAFLPTSPTP